VNPCAREGLAVPVSYRTPVELVIVKSGKSIGIHIYVFLGLYGLPPRNGKLKDISKFDAAFFGVHPKQANSMDPQLRLLLEVTYEAIIDAGRS